MNRLAERPVYDGALYHRLFRGWKLSRLLAALCAGVISGQPAWSAQQAPDLILFDGHIFTSDPGHLHAEALAIRGERITAVGETAAIEPLADSHTKLIDLHGRTVIPGLNDAHAHLGIWPADEVFVETEGYNPNWSELQEALRKASAHAPKGTILSGTIGTAIFYDPAIDKTTLDKAVPDHPVVLETFDGHVAILNTPALHKLGIDEGVADPAGGRFERDRNGKLTGVVRENAVDTVQDRLNAITSDADAEMALRQQLEHAARYGITTIQDMPIGMSPIRTATLLAHVPTPIRVRITPMNMALPEGLGHPSPLVSVNGTKWVLDGVVFEGSLTSRNGAAANSQVAGGPYSFAGLPPLYPPKTVEGMLRDALRSHYQLQFHVAGRPAAIELLDAMEHTGGAAVWGDQRLRFEHGDGLTPDLITRVKKLGVIVSQQGTHLDIAGIDPGLGPHLLERMRVDRVEPLRSLLAEDVNLALGSDGPLNPWLSIFGATTDPNRPDEAISREQAVIAYTFGSAFAEFAEKDKGSLAPGKLADLAVLSQDIFTVAPLELHKTRSVLTLVGGQSVYEAPEPGKAASR